MQSWGVTVKKEDIVFLDNRSYNAPFISGVNVSHCESWYTNGPETRVNSWAYKVLASRKEDNGTAYR